MKQTLAERIAESIAKMTANAIEHGHCSKCDSTWYRYSESDAAHECYDPNC